MTSAFLFDIIGSEIKYMAKLKNKKNKAVRLVKNKKAGAADNLSSGVHKTKIRVIGIGGGGGSIIAEVAPHLRKVDFISANTDAQALKAVGKAVRTFQFGQALTRGLGCGMDPKVGKNAAKEAETKISGLFKDVDLAIFVSSLGGGTGAGAAPEFARIAKESGVMTFGIFTTPFKFEGVKRAQIAKFSLERLKPYLNVFSVIPNENIFRIINKDTPITESFSAINRRLAENLLGLVQMIYSPGIINIDFADLKTILDGKGKLAYLNSATGQGENRSEDAVKALLSSPLNEYGINGAEKILFNITASKDLGMAETEFISESIAGPNRRAKIIFGVSQDNNCKSSLRVCLLAVGCGQNNEKCPEGPESKIDDDPKPAPKPKIKKKIKPNRRSKLHTKKPSKPLLPIKPKAKPSVKKVEVKRAPLLAEDKTFPRKNGLDLKKEAEKTEQELFQEETKWDTPAFLRRQESQ